MTRRRTPSFTRRRSKSPRRRHSASSTRTFRAAPSAAPSAAPRALVHYTLKLDVTNEMSLRKTRERVLLVEMKITPTPSVTTDTEEGTDLSTMIDALVTTATSLVSKNFEITSNMVGRGFNPFNSMKVPQENANMTIQSVVVGLNVFGNDIDTSPLEWAIRGMLAAPVQSAGGGGMQES